MIVTMMFEWAPFRTDIFLSLCLCTAEVTATNVDVVIASYFVVTSGPVTADSAATTENVSSIGDTDAYSITSLLCSY